MTFSLSKTQVDKAGAKLAAFWASGRRVQDLSAAERAELRAALEVIEAFRQKHAAPLRLTNANLRHYVTKYPGAVTVTQRLKKTSTVIDKLCREPTMKLSRMEDIGGARVVLPDQASVDDMARRLKKNWKIRRERDYVRDGKASGYRAVHLIAVKKDTFVEVQLRTPLQDRWANLVEHDSRALRSDFKSGAGAAEVHEYYRGFSDLIALREQHPDQAVPQELLQRVQLSYAAAKPFLRPDDLTP